MEFTPVPVPSKRKGEGADGSGQTKSGEGRPAFLISARSDRAKFDVADSQIVAVSSRGLRGAHIRKHRPEKVTIVPPRR